MLVVLALGLVSVAVAQQPTRLVIANLRVFTGARVIEGATIAVADGKIIGIAATPSVRASVTIDGTGKTALPGLIDVHVHMLVGITEADTRRFIENALKEKAAGLPATRGDGGGVSYGAVSTSNTGVENSSRWSSDKASDSQATSLLPVISTTAPV
jgi:predicted amidohydrolase YtcJ